MDTFGHPAIRETGAVDELYPLEWILWLTWQGVLKAAHALEHHVKTCANYLEK